MRSFAPTFLSALAVAFLSSPTVAQDAVADFYRGKQITMHRGQVRRVAAVRRSIPRR